MRVFVTGGSGFVGRNVIGALRDRGDDVRALARSDRAADVVHQLGAEPVRGDLDDVAAMQAGMTGCDVVIHAAANVDSWGRAEQFHRVNVQGTKNVIHAARAAGVPRLAHVSTEAVLAGGPPIRNADETWPLPDRPIGLYGATKGEAERRVLAANNAALQTIIVRPRMVWGEGDTTLLPRIADSVRRGQWMWIDGGRYLTSTCHVANVCEGVILAAERGRGGEIYFLTDGPPIAFRTFATALVRSQGLEPGNRSIPHGVATALASIAEWTWRSLRLPGAPPIDRATVALAGAEVTVSDAKARRELGYVGHVDRATALTALTRRSEQQSALASA